MDICTYIYMYVCVYIYTWACMYVHTYKYMHNLVVSTSHMKLKFKFIFSCYLKENTMLVIRDYQCVNMIDLSSRNS